MRVGPKRATIAGMNLAGIGIAALVMGAVLIGVSVAGGSPAAFWSVLYSEAKSLVAALGPTLAIVVGAWIGFRGVRDPEPAPSPPPE